MNDDEQYQRERHAAAVQARREAVARAIFGAEQAMFAEDAGREESAEDLARELDDHSMRDPDFNHYWTMTDAAIAACNIPEYYLALDDGSIDRAIAAVATELNWPNEREGSAEIIVATVLKALEAQHERP